LVERIVPVEKVPLKGLLPLQAPEAVQEVAFVLLQVSLEPLFLSSGIVVGLAVSVTVGTTPTVTCADAVALTEFVQVSTKVVG
jgi:hypothetical protein